ncbi:hypothetical protein AKO1_014595 [Acrasis kona]|uniref:PITH domain-containing protein n=1 Tax=Acrasis kona TaxID=1008807 RepID=A0AAW2Z3T2_9EUKA
MTIFNVLAKIFSTLFSSENDNEESCDIMQKIDESKVECINQSTYHTVKHLIQNSNAIELNYNKYLESGSDELLLIHIPFVEEVHLTQIEFFAPQDDSCPQLVKLFVNKQDMNLDDALSTKPQKDIGLSHSDVTEKNPTPFNLGSRKFSNVSTLSILVQDNYGGDSTKLYAVRFSGKALGKDFE